MRPDACDDAYIAYLAGFFDGEGCVRIQTRGSTVNVSIANTYLPTLNEYERRYGGKVVLQSRGTLNHRPQFAWVITGPKAASFLSSILPYLKEKREQARLAIEYQNLPRPRNKSEHGAAISQQIRKLKRPIYDFDTGEYHYAPHLLTPDERSGHELRDVGADDLPRDLPPAMAVGAGAGETTQQQPGERA